METETSFVGANGAVELYAVSQVGLNFALVVNPCNTESENTVGFNHTFYDFGFLKLGVLVVNLFYRFQHFVYSLKEFLLARMLGLEVGHDFINIHVSQF